MIVVTTITSTLDPDTMVTSHSVDIEDQDGISDVHPDVLGAVLIGAMRSTERALAEQFPGAGRSAERADEREAVDIDDA